MRNATDCFFGDMAHIEEFLNELVLEDPDFGNIIADKKEKLGQEAFLETVRRLVLQITEKSSGWNIWSRWIICAHR